MKILFLGVAIGALSISAAAAATDGVQAQTSAKPKKERRICKTAIRSGSNLSTTICKTHSEWQALEANYDPDSEEAGVPGNRSATGRSTNIGASQKATMGAPN